MHPSLAVTRRVEPEVRILTRKGKKKKQSNGGSEEYGANCIRVDRASLAFLEPFDTGNDDLENSLCPAAAREAFLIIFTTVLFLQI